MVGGREGWRGGGVEGWRGGGGGGGGGEGWVAMIQADTCNFFTYFYGHLESLHKFFTLSFLD